MKPSKTKHLVDRSIYHFHNILEKENGEWLPRFIFITSISFIFILIPLVVFFLWNANFDIGQSVDHEKLGTFGDFFGGVVGAIWSLCGIILFYIALTQQRKDFTTNREALTKQVEALNLQVKEFGLQRDELRQSREVFTEQAKTLRQQRFDSTYFSLINLYREINNSLNQQSDSMNYFKDLKALLYDFKKEEIKDPINKYHSTKSHAERVIFEKLDDLSSYFKIIYRVLKTIDDCEINEKEKFQYLKIFRSQLSEGELLAIYYYSHSEYAGELYSYILRYNLLKHIKIITKIEFSELSFESHGFYFSHLSEEVTRYISHVLNQINENYMKENFEKIALSKHLSIDNNIIVSLESEDFNSIDIELELVNSSADICGMNKVTFSEYFELFLYDIFLFSRYLPQTHLVSVETNDLSFKVSSKNKLSINSDGEY